MTSTEKIFWDEVTAEMRLTAEGGSWFANGKLVYWTGQTEAEARATLGQFFQAQIRRDTEAQGAEALSVYTDFQAVDDGVLVDISKLGLKFEGKPVNRMTRTAWG